MRQLPKIVVWDSACLNSATLCGLEFTVCSEILVFTFHHLTKRLCVFFFHCMTVMNYITTIFILLLRIGE